MPYWKRPETARKSLALYAKHYGGLDFECILVDDGSHDFVCEAYPWLKIVQLPKKDAPMNPCVPINRGVKESKGEVICLTGPDILHNKPVLPQLLEELKSMGEKGYVLAACWYPRGEMWHCHSSLTAGGKRDNFPQPVGSGYHFCAMFYRDLWDEAGGFDERYRDGAFYDDPDWVFRAAKAGAKFKVRDDLVVEHTRDGAEINWPSGMESRNQKLFRDTWNV